MKITQLLPAVAAVALLLTACGTTEDTTSGEPETSADPAAGEPITLTDARGEEITLDGPAVRVAGTEWNVVEYLVSLGIQPVGVSDIEGYNTWVSSEKLDESATDIGTRGEPSLDALAGLDLDAVFVTDALIEGAVEQIEDSGIPVIVVPGGDSTDPIGTMFENLDLVAKATGTEDEAADLRADFDDAVAEGKEAVEAAGAAGQAVAFSDAYDTGSAISIRPFPSGSLVAAVLEEIGLPSAWGPEIEGDPVYGLGQTDVEGLTNLADVPFWYIANDDTSPDPYTEGLAGNAVWNSLPFVQSGQVHRFPDSIWMFGGPASMEQVIDAAVDALG